jgi:hypothetical protein
MHIRKKTAPLLNIMRPQCTARLQAKLQNLLTSKVDGVAGHINLRLLCYVEVYPTSCTLVRTLVEPQRRSGHGDKDRPLVPAKARNPQVQPLSNYKTQDAVI